MASSPMPGYTEELRRHSPHSEAIVKHSGNGITLTCVCGAPVLAGAGESSLKQLTLAIAAHARQRAELAVARTKLFGAGE